MATRRIVLFTSRAGWWQTDEFVGDKDELEAERAVETCDCGWRKIARRFFECRTLAEFQAAAEWAVRQYHSQLPAPLVRPKLYHGHTMATRPDEIMIVREDLGVTGINSFLRCPTCGQMYPVTFMNDGMLRMPSPTCLTCGSPMVWFEAVPSPDAWTTAVKMYRQPPATFIVTTEKEKVRDPVAKLKYGQPVKLAKIVQYDPATRELVFEAVFRDWRTALVRPSELQGPDVTEKAFN